MFDTRHCSIRNVMRRVCEILGKRKKPPPTKSKVQCLKQNESVRNGIHLANTPTKCANLRQQAKQDDLIKVCDFLIEISQQLPNSSIDCNIFVADRFGVFTPQSSFPRSHSTCLVCSGLYWQSVTLG